MNVNWRGWYILTKKAKNEVIKETLREDIKKNMLKIRECLKNGDQAGADHYSALNQQLRRMVRWKLINCWEH